MNKPKIKYLTLIRHAKSNWNHPDLSDFDRPLNERGIHSASMMGQRLAKREVCPDYVVSSPAKRAMTTACLLTKELAFPELSIVTNDNIYFGDLKRLLAVIQSVDDQYHDVMLFGHNPIISELGDYLANPGVGDMPTCAMLRIQLLVDNWQAVGYKSAQLVFFDYPKNHSSE